ncbi:N-acetylneuraminate synthase [Polaribacter sp. MED152]|uniref:N-acetylneuraminate synthase n=1 Tax=Polaribacter sp. MED152 TaxID=313598 RepID=UPI000068C9A0|nr:N-acetylneuraminate synthase [Polaribacter sp. MED152]EAQ42185.1 N-acetylneuraminate synthase [Polaribacter sp. MED152]
MRKKVLIIAEAGVNHNGDIKKAKKLIDVACNAGVDYVKFQSFKADKLVSKEAKKAEYQKKNINDNDDSQFEMLKKLELSEKNHLELQKYCTQKGVQFFSTAFDVEGVHYLDSLNFNIFKIPSGEITNYPYLKAIAQKKKPVILSTGMSNLNEIETALKIITENGVDKKNVTILHCNTEYPTPMKDVNLKAMNTIGEKLKVNVGYSDHTLGIEVPIAAVALGATVIEKHFTLDRNLPGPDHRASLEPLELKQMVSAIRNIEEAISGNGIKEPSKSEKKNISIARKSIHLKKGLKEGEVINEEDIISLRPGDGICSMKWNEIIGKKVSKDLEGFHKLTWEDLL